MYEKNNKKTLTSNVEDKMSFDNLISIRSDCLKHIFELENLNWKSVTTLSTITTAILLLIANNPDFKYLGFYVILLLNFIGNQILFRNRQVFLQNVFLMSQIEEKLPDISAIRPKDWDYRNIDAFKKAFPLGSHWTSLVLTHIFLVIGTTLFSVVLLWVECSNLLTFLKLTFTWFIFPAVAFFIVLYFITYQNYRKWFEKSKNDYMKNTSL